MTTTTTTYVGPDQGARHPMIDGVHVAKAAVSDGQGAFEVFLVEAPPLPPAPPHVAPWTGVLYLLEGRVTVQVDGERHELAPGALAVFPAGSACTFDVHDEPARLLAITSGHGAGRFFADFARSVPADRPVEEALPAILDVTQRHGVAVNAG